MVLAACGGDEDRDAMVIWSDGEIVGTLPPDASLVPVSDEELLVRAYVSFVDGVRNADLGTLRLALCRNVYTDRTVDELTERIAAIPAATRLVDLESTLLSQMPGALSIRAEATVGGRRGIIDVAVVDDDLGCVRSVDTDDATAIIDPDFGL